MSQLRGDGPPPPAPIGLHGGFRYAFWKNRWGYTNETSHSSSLIPNEALLVPDF